MDTTPPDSPNAPIVEAGGGTRESDSSSDDETIDMAHPNSAAAAAAAAAVAAKAAAVAPPKLDRGPEDQTLTWKVSVDDILRAATLPDRKVTIPGGQMHGANWNLLVFHGHEEAKQHVSIFLSVAAHTEVDPTYTLQGIFRISVLNHVNEAKSPQQSDFNVQTWSARHHDWGFWKMIELQLVRDLHAGGTSDLARDNQFTIVARIIRSAPRPEPRLISYNSRSETGYTGIENQGATCYLNSLLQSLFHVPAFRRAVYAMPVAADQEASKSVPLALQRLFYNLSKSETAARTRELTKSFGWDNYEAFTQHDVQEMLRVLTDNLEEKMKESGQAGLIQNLFRGELQNYIECINVHCVSVRNEPFYDLALNVKGCATLYDSIDKFIEEEVLDGDNKYRSDDHGLQAARRGIRLHKLPPVLHMQLKRFDYDPYTDMTQKVNTRHEFPLTLELDRYLGDNVERPDGQPFTYDLYGVLVHAGDVGGGHYYAYIRPTQAADWFRFDDDKITKAPFEEAVEGNYGGPAPSPFGDPINLTSTTNLRRHSAYMLVYVLRSAADRIMRPLTDAELPPTLEAAIKHEEEMTKRAVAEKALAHLYRQVGVITLDYLRKVGGEGCDMLPLKPAFKPPIVRLERAATVARSKRAIAEAAGLNPDDVRLWALYKRRNDTVRIGRHYCSAKRQLLTIDAVFAESLLDMVQAYGTDCLIVAESASDTDRWDDPALINLDRPAGAAPDEENDDGSDDERPPAPVKPDEPAGAGAVVGAADAGAVVDATAAADAAAGAGDVAAVTEESATFIANAPVNAKWQLPAAQDRTEVLVKRYEMDVNGNSQIELLGFVTVSRWATVAQMMPVLRRMGRYADDETLYVFEEETWNKRVPSIVSEKRDRSSSTLVELKLAFGDILIIQAAPKDMPPEESEEDETLEMQVRRSYPYTAQQYFQMMRRRVDLILQPFAYADGVKADPLPPLLLSADKQWSMGVSFERVVRIYNNATARWLADSERSAAEAKAKHTASDGTDPHLNAQLREATAALAEAQIRAATPLLADHIRLYEHPAHASSPPTALSLKDGEKLQNTLALAYTSKARKLYYERLPMSRAQLLECYDLRTQHGSLSGAMRSSVRIFVPKNGKVGDVIAAVRAKLAESSSHAGLAAAAGVQHAPPSPRPPHADDEEQAPGDALRLSTTITDAADIEDDTVETDALLCLKLSHDRLATVMQPEWPLDHMEMPTLAYGTTSELVMVPISKYESRLQASATAPLFIVQALDAQIDTFSIKVRGHPQMLHCADPNTTFGDIRARIAARLNASHAAVLEWKFGTVIRGTWLNLSALRYLHEANSLGPALGDTGAAATPTAAAAADQAPVDRYEAYQDMKISELLAGNKLLVFVRPASSVQDVHAKRRRYQMPQKSIKIYG